MTNNNEKQINFFLRGIELLDFSLIHPQRMKQDNNFHFNIDLEYKINADNIHMALICRVGIMDSDKQTKLGSISASCIFEIQGPEGFSLGGQNQQNLPGELLVALNSVAISTTRGIMFSQFKGTFLHNAFLPLIDPKAFVKNA